MRTRNLRKFTTALSALLLAAVLALPAIPVSATESSDAQTIVGSNLIELVITSTNEYVTYQDEKFTISFEQKEKGTDSELGEATNETRVAIDSVTVNASQDLKARSNTGDKADGTNVKNTVATGPSSWTRTVYGSVDLSGFNAPGIYTYKVTVSHANSANTLSSWTVSQAEYELCVVVEDVGSDRDYAVTTAITQKKKDDGENTPATSKNKASNLKFTSSVTAPTLTLTKNVEERGGTEQALAKSQGYPFFITYDDKSLTELKYYVLNEDGSVNLSDVKTVNNISYSWFYLEKGQTVVFINLPEKTSAVKVQEGKDGGKNSLAPGAGAKDLGVTKIKYSVYYEGVLDDNKSSKNDKDFGSENSMSNLNIKGKGTVINWTNIIEPDITPTGVVTSIAPYVTLVLVAGAAVAAYIILKNRMR